MNALILNLPPILKLTDEQFEQLAAANRDLRLELTALGELVIMPPTGGNTGKRDIDLSFQIQAWNRQNQLGVAFDSSTASRLPNGAKRSPDASWVRQARWDALTPEQQDTFPPLCPDFAVGLRSRTDSLEELRAKMREYLDNGLQLGWLIDPKTRQVEIYRSDRAVEFLPKNWV